MAFDTFDMFPSSVTLIASETIEIIKILIFIAQIFYVLIPSNLGENRGSSNRSELVITTFDANMWKNSPLMRIDIEFVPVHKKMLGYYSKTIEG
jgi:hypothetical protein